MAERELIATYVSSQNDCSYCQTSFGAIAAYHLNGNDQLVVDIKRDFESAEVSDKLKALLAIAGKVQRGGKNVLAADVERARKQSATDLEIHDTVLIAAAFCMYNRYVDGLATWAPTDPEGFRERAAAVARNGYIGVLAAATDAQAVRSADWRRIALTRSRSDSADETRQRSDTGRRPSNQNCDLTPFAVTFNWSCRRNSYLCRRVLCRTE